MEMEVDEVAVGAAIDGPTHDPDTVLALHELTGLTNGDVWLSGQVQILIVKIRARHHGPCTRKIQTDPSYDLPAAL